MPFCARRQSGTQRRNGRRGRANSAVGDADSFPSFSVRRDGGQCLLLRSGGQGCIWEVRARGRTTEAPGRARQILPISVKAGLRAT